MDTQGPESGPTAPLELTRPTKRSRLQAATSAPTDEAATNPAAEGEEGMEIKKVVVKVFAKSQPCSAEQCPQARSESEAVPIPAEDTELQPKAWPESQQDGGHLGFSLQTCRQGKARCRSA